MEMTVMRSHTRTYTHAHTADWRRLFKLMNFIISAHVVNEWQFKTFIEGLIRKTAV